MGKTADDMQNLSVLIDSTAGPSPKIDDVPNVIKRSPGRPKKKVVEYYSYCGMAVPNAIYDICMYLEGLLKEQGKYTPALGPQIYNCAVQQWVYNDLITAKVTGREPVATRQLTTASESLRRALQSTGLTIQDKKSGITKEQTVEDPTIKFMNKIEGGSEDVIVKKTKKKSSK